MADVLREVKTSLTGFYVENIIMTMLFAKDEE